MKISGSEALIQSLLKEGVDTLFGYPGGQIIPVYDTLYKYQKELRHILVRHEQGAIHAAEGYARVSGRVGTVMVTSGPAATNVITGIADAMLDSTPIVVIAGQVGKSLLGTDAFQEIDLIGTTLPITKWNYQIRSAEEVAWAVARAYYIVRSGRPGPVVLDFTKNAQVEMTEFEYKPCTFIQCYVPKLTPKREDILRATKMINEAKQPFVLVGQGAILSGAEEVLKKFLKKADIPAASTLLGLSALETNFSYNMGMLGMHGNIGCNIKTNECDVLLAVGMRFDDRVTGNLDKYAKQAQIIHIDIDPSEIDKNVKSNLSLVGDAKEVLELLLDEIHENNHREWIDSFKPYQEEEYHKVIEKECFSKEGMMKMGEVVCKVSEKAKKGSVLVTDVGQNQMIGARYFNFTQTRSIVTSGGLGTMGFGLPAAIGAKLGNENRTVCLFCGDGGLQMTIQELGTIMQYNIPMKIILLNNHFLGMVRQWQELFFNKHYSQTPMKNPDFVQIASAYNIPSKRVEKREELDDAIQEMFREEGAFLLEVVVEDNEMVYPMVPPGESITNMILE